MMLAEKVTWTQMMERAKHKREVADLKAAVERVLAWGTNYKQSYEAEQLRVGVLVGLAALLLTAFVLAIWARGAWGLLLMLAGALGFGYCCYRNGQQLGVLDGELQAAQRQRKVADELAKEGAAMRKLLRDG